MEWTDHAIVLSTRPLGERAAVVSVLTLQHGRWLGRVQNAQSGSKKAWLSAGSLVQGSWHARLDEQLGTFALELTEHSAAHVFDNRMGLLALDYLAALTDCAAPERLPLPLLYQALLKAVQHVAHETGTTAPTGLLAAATVADYERTLLDVMGYGLDLSGCAVTGVVDDLVALSPHSGRAVCRAAAAPYGDKLLPLPQHWLTGVAPSAAQLAESFHVTGHFLQQHFYQAPRALPPQRAHILSALAGAANVSAA